MFQPYNSFVIGQYTGNTSSCDVKSVNEREEIPPQTFVEDNTRGY